MSLFGMLRSRQLPTPSRSPFARRGAATVEFAVVAPLLLFGIALPILEFGRGMMGSELVCNAARAGCRAGVIPRSSNTTITTAVNELLSSNQITGANTTVKVNGNSVDASTAIQGDTLSVTVTVAYSNISWLPAGLSVYLNGRSVSSTQVMRCE